MNLFLDESGECSFSSRSASKHFVITILSIEDNYLKRLKNTIKRYNAGIINAGWNKTKEIKASKINSSRRFGQVAIRRIIEKLIGIDSLEVSYIVVNKDRMTYPPFRNSPYGIPYNYFTGLLLSELIFYDNIHDVHLIYDKRNKETHSNRHFREYLVTKIHGNAFEQNIEVRLQIEGQESHRCYGLAAVDYFSWAIYRKFEYDDPSFFRLFAQKIKRRREWYT